ncbi:MAG: protocatechuate 3,4-dioxygenase subunit beta [Pseudomonadota bacterium]|jgi:protocatechuate 3,4-dioxygenase beta subunit
MNAFPISIDTGRRSLLLAGAGALLLPCAYADTKPAALPATPAQTEGPFYPQASFFSTRSDVDSDLLTVPGAREASRGIPLALSGRILASDGRPLAGALVEIWQCDARGQYAYDMPTIYRAESGFQGFGRAITSASGAYAFRTIRPVPYAGRPPHIHFKVWSSADKARQELLTTQMYVRGEAYANDFVLRAVRNDAARERLIADLVQKGNELTAQWDVVVAV